MKKNLIKKNDIIEGVDIEGYLKAILEEYERFYTDRRSDFNSFVKKAEESLFTKLTFTSLRLRNKEKEKEKELLEIFKKYEEKITKKDIEIDKAIEEKRRLLILAIKKTRGINEEN
ncbi:hypothetical protein ES708_22374 [subsurface metagenome]